MNRLDSGRAFAVEAEKAQEQFFDEPEKPSISTLTDYYDHVGHPMARADTIRRLHKDHAPARPFRGREGDLLDRMTHPAVLEARETAEELRAELEDCPGSDLQRLARLKTALSDALENVEEKRERIEEIEARIDAGKTLDAEQLSILVDREIDPKTETLTTLDGETLLPDTSHHLGTMHEGFGSSALWGPPSCRKLYRDLPRRLLRRRSRKVEDKPRERSVAEHVAEVGIERLLDADPHFDRQPTTLFISNYKSGKTTEPPRKRAAPGGLGE